MQAQLIHRDLKAEAQRNRNNLQGIGRIRDRQTSLSRLIQSPYKSR